MLIYTRQSSGRKRKSQSKRLAASREEHKKFLASIGYTERRNPKVEFPNLKVENGENVGRLSNDIPGAGGYKRSVDDYKWKRDATESAATIAEIERKKKRVAPAYNKGPVMLITEGTDPAHLGRKI